MLTAPFCLRDVGPDPAAFSGDVDPFTLRSVAVGFVDIGVEAELGRLAMAIAIDVLRLLFLEEAAIAAGW